MKKSVKRMLCGTLAFACVSTLGLESVLRTSANAKSLLGNTNTNVSASGDSLAFENVTGKYDTSTLRQSYFNDEVQETQTATYERRTVIVSLDGDCMLEAANKNGVTYEEYSESFSGQVQADKIRSAQDAFLYDLKKSGVSYTVEHRYDAVLNGVAIEVNTKHVSAMKKMAGVDSVVIATTYAEPETITDASSITNATSVYQTGIYDSSAFTEYGDGEGVDYGEGTVIAILDTGLDYTHEAFQNQPTLTEDSWTKGEVETLMKKALTAKTKTSGLSVNDVYVSSKVPFAYDYADNDPDVYPSYSNHGTHVAGIIGGYSENGYTDKDGVHVNETFRGVVPDSQLVICKVFTDDLDSKDIGGAEAENIIAALNDCVMLGVDVINMSLGTSCGFTTTNDGDDEGELLNDVYNEIQTAGISLVCAASNDYSSGYGSVFGTNQIKYPDSSTVGSPSTFASALSVASISGQKSPYMQSELKEGDYKGQTVHAFFEESRDENGKAYDFVEQMLGSETSKEFKYYVISGTGTRFDYSSLKSKIKGNIALVQRGGNTFQEKVEIAMDMGAKAIIVYNNVAGVIRMNLGEIDDPIPAVSIPMDAGKLLASIGVNRSGTITISKDMKAGPFMSEFSSWGPTHDLKIKPEITAHGGEITSTVPGGYGEQSGTSMASPNMAGVMALVRSYIKNNATLKALVTEQDGKVNEVKVNRLANQLIMSTATTVVDQDGEAYSPRKQGAGLGSLDNVINKTGAYLSVQKTVDGKDNVGNDYRPKLELGDDAYQTGRYTMTFTVHNFGGKALAFDTNALVFTETIASGGFAVAEDAYDLAHTANWSVSGEGAAIENGVFTMDATCKSAEITVSVQLKSSAKKHLDQFENGMYVEGFLKLLSKNGDQCDLSIPFLGFYGDWESGDMLDHTVYEVAKEEADASITDENKIQANVWATQPFSTYYNEKYILPMGSYVYLYDEDEHKLYANEEYNAISRYNNVYEDENQNYLTSTAVKAVYAGLLRNARLVTWELYDVQTGELIKSDVINRVGKAYAGGGSAVPANVELNIEPDEYGLISNGKYRVDLKFYMNNPETNDVYWDPNVEQDANNNTDEYSFTFTVDYEAPVLEDVRVRYYDYKDANGKAKQRVYLDVDVYDNHYAQALLLCYPTTGANGELVLNLATEYPTPVEKPVKNGTTTVSIEVTDFYEKYGANFYIQVDDYAINTCLYKIDITKANSNNTPVGGIFDLADGEENITLDIYETHKVALVYEGNANLSNFTWSSNRQGVAQVKNGEIVGLRKGTATITVSCGTSLGDKKTINVTVTDRMATSLPAVAKLGFGEITTSGKWLTKAEGFVEVSAGETYTLPVLKDPWYHPMDGYTIEWTTNNPEVATVDQNGVIKTLKDGMAVIKAIPKKGTELLNSYGCSVTLIVADEFDVSNYTLVDYNGVGYNGEICGNCGKPWDYEELVYDATGADTVKDNCPDCGAVVAGGVTVLKIPTDMNIMYIGEDAFKDNANIVRVVIPSSVVNINESAFEHCTALEEVYFTSTKSRETYDETTGDKIEEDFDIDWSDLSLVYKKAFYNCPNLKKIDLSNVKTIMIADYVFADCPNLSTIVDMTSIGTAHHYAFANCSSLQTVDLTGLHVSGNYVFSGCTGLTEVLTDKFTAIGNYMFSGCTKLSEMTIRTAKVGDGAFKECTKLSQVRFENALDGTSLVYEIGTRAFENCGAAAGEFDVVFGNGARSIGNYAFRNSALSYFTMPYENLISLGTNIFAGTSVSRLVIDDGWDFDMLDMLGVPFENVTIDVVFDSTKYALDTNGYVYDTVNGVKRILHVNPNVTTTNGTLTIDGDVIIGDYAFAANTSVSQLKITNGSILEIGKGAFYNSALQNLVGTLAIDAIPAYAFYGSALLNFELPNEITEIGDYAFANNEILQSVAYGANTALTTIGAGAFENCVSLSHFYNNDNSPIPVAGKIVLPETVKTLGRNAFGGCTAIVSVEIPAVETFGYGAFVGASSLKWVTFGNAVTTTGMGTFAETSVKYVTLGENLTEIGGYAFMGCKDLTTIDLSGVKTVGSFAFTGCTALTSVDLSVVEKVGSYAFNATGLLSVTLPDEKPVNGKIVLETYAFGGSTKLATIDLGAVEEIHELAFWNTALTSVDLQAAKVIGAGAFAEIATLTEFTFDSEKENANFVAIDNVLYRYVNKDKGEYELVCYPAGLTAEKVGDTRVYEIVEGTLKVGAYAVYGLKKGAIDEVVLPYTVNSIGDSAFFGSGVKTYTFESIEAPALENEYDMSIEKTIESIELAMQGKYKGYYYTNFETHIFNFTSYANKPVKVSTLKINYPENGVGYDNYIYNLYFGEKATTGVHITDATRSARDVINVLEDANVVKSWIGGGVTKAYVTEYAEKVKSVRQTYNNIVNDEKQMEFFGEENVKKLLAIETQLRAVKKAYNIPLSVTTVDYVVGSYKDKYGFGESFNMSGLKLVLYYDDGSTETVGSSNVTLLRDTPFENEYDNEVYVQYGDQVIQLYVEIAEEYATPAKKANIGLIIGVVSGVVVLGGGAAAVVLVMRKRKLKAGNTETPNLLDGDGNDE